MRLLGETKAADHLMPKKVKSRKIDDELYSEIQKRYDLGMELRRPEEQRWILDLAFIAGQQYVLFNSTAHILQIVSKIKGKRRTVDNILLPRWKRQVADLIKNTPIMTVIPDTNEEEDIKAAKVGTKVLKHLYKTIKMKKKTRQLAGWIFATGNGFLDDRWKAKAGPTKFTEKGELIYLGDADVGVWSPFEIVVPAYHMGDVDLHSFPWLIKAKYRSLEYLADNYVRGNEVVAESMPSPVMGANLISGSTSVAEGKVKGAVLKECYVQPCGQFPKGAFITGAGGIILQTSEYPYEYYNIEHFKELDIPGKFWGKSTVDTKIPQQIRWNRINNSIDEFNEVMAKGKLLAPKRSGLEVVPDDTHGEVIYYKPVLGHKPDYITMKGTPGTYNDALAITKGSIQDGFSQHEVTSGTNRSDLRSGEMVSLLREQDAHGSIPSHMVFEESFEAVMSRVLIRVQKGYDEQRMIKVVGKDGEFEVFAFKGSDLRNNTDVSVKRQSSLPDSRIERQLMIERRFEKGFYGDPADPEVRRHVMNMLDDAIVDDIYSDTRLDETYSRWENQVLANSDVDIVLINDYDDHNIHLKEHNHFRKTMDYQRIKLADSRLFMVLEERFVKHTMFHQQYLNQARQQFIEERKLLEGGD